MAMKHGGYRVCVHCADVEILHKMDKVHLSRLAVLQ